MKVLIIDDDEDDTLILSDALKNVWPDSSCHISGSHGEWKMYLQNKETVPDIIFIDAFPLRGKKCFEELTNLDIGNDLKIIVYTDESRPLEIKEYKSMGASEILLKTGNYEELKISLSLLKST